MSTNLCELMSLFQKYIYINDLILLIKDNLIDGIIIIVLSLV